MENLKLFLLKRKEVCWCEDDQMVVLAPNEEEAMHIAQASSSDFNGDFLQGKFHNTIVTEIALDQPKAVLTAVFTSNVGNYN